MVFLFPCNSLEVLLRMDTGCCIQSNLARTGADDIPSVLLFQERLLVRRKLIEDIEGNINLFISETKSDLKYFLLQN